MSHPPRSFPFYLTTGQTKPPRHASSLPHHQIMGNEVSSTKTTTSSTSTSTSDEDRQRAIRRMDQTIAAKLGKGVSYNMKVVLKGERGSGKSSLLQRLQGLPFTSASSYVPTPEIQTATINWSYKEGGEEAVKVEVWDVVDRGIRRGGGSGNDIATSGTNNSSGTSTNTGATATTAAAADPDALAGIPLDTPASLMALSGGAGGKGGKGHVCGLLDASILDVYKGCQSAVFVINPFSSTALDYLRKEIPQVPSHIPILLLLNFADLMEGESEEDQGEEKNALPATPIRLPDVTLEQLKQEFVVETGTGKRTVHAFACSMSNCYGLKTLYFYLGVPFLAMKEEGLRRQLEQTSRELEGMKVQVDETIAKDSWVSYGTHLRSKDKEEEEKEEARKRPAPPPPTQTLSSPATVTNPSITPANVERKGVAASSCSNKGLEEHKSSSLSAGGGSQLRHQRKPPATIAATAAARLRETPTPQLADVDDFTYKPKERSELDAWLADDGEEPVDEAEEARRREAERRRQSLTSCIKPGSLRSLSKAERRAAGMFTSDGEDDDDDDGEQQYVSLKPVNLHHSRSQPREEEEDVKKERWDEEEDYEADVLAGLPLSSSIGGGGGKAGGGRGGIPDYFDGGGGGSSNFSSKMTRASPLSSSSTSLSPNSTALSEAARAAIAATMQELSQGGGDDENNNKKEKGEKKKKSSSSSSFSTHHHRKHKKKSSSSGSSSHHH